MQSIKNFIRHGKQARVGQPGHAEPAVGISTVHAHQQRHDGGVDRQHVTGGEVGIFAGVARVADQYQHQQEYQHQQHQHQKQQQQQHQQKQDRKAEYDPSVVERIVAEERESRGKMPRYPGLDRWILLEKMGDGAFSNVYKARDSTGQHPDVAIKVVRKYEMNSSQGDDVLHPDFKKAPKVVERANILKEVQIMRNLEHPNIVKLIQFLESPQYYYIILELCPGGELFHQIVRLTYFSENLSRHVIVQVAEALEYLHETAGVVHRDIKPENLLFYPIPFVATKNPKPMDPDTEDKVEEGEFIKGVGSGGIGVIKVADFGLSKVIWDNQTMTPCGTVGYTAPEIVKDERYSKSVDMWALGCVLYTLLCGFPPFYDESIQALTEKVARGQYTFLSPWWDDISKSAQDLISNLLTVDPDKRYNIKQFLNHPWIRETEEETESAADAPPLATPQNRMMMSTTPQSAHPLDLSYLIAPESGGQRGDFRSPGAVNLREVFDVGYAVHRQEEEAKRRKYNRQGLRGVDALNQLNEEDMLEDEAEYEDGEQPSEDGGSGSNASARSTKTQPTDVSAMEQKLRNTTLSAAAQARQQAAAAATGTASNGQGHRQRHGYGGQGGGHQQGYGQHSAAVAAGMRSRQARSNRAGAFELSLDNATLLGRRGKKPDPSGLREQIAIR